MIDSMGFVILSHDHAIHCIGVNPGATGGGVGSPLNIIIS